jgi:hypothetical protein
VIAGATEPTSVELREDQVKSVWIDPDFAQQFGIEVPADGWKKKKMPNKTRLTIPTSCPVLDDPK